LFTHANWIKLCRLKYTYKHFTFFDLLQDGYVRTHAELFRLINYEEARRQEAGPKVPLWFKKTLVQQPDKLCMMARRLMQAENAMRIREYAYRHSATLPINKPLRTFSGIFTGAHHLLRA